MKTRLFKILFCLPFLIQCTGKDASQGKGLSYKEAKSRKEALSSINYVFNINLKNAETQDHFEGQSSVQFDYNKNSSLKHLRLDFGGGKVLSLNLNGKKQKVNYDGHFLSLSTKELKASKNELEIQFQHPFSKNGSGLYKFVDQQDKNTYLYTDFEPYDANLFAPLFDQPNLKATYTLNVEAPLSWTVITSVKPSEIVIKGDHKKWLFPRSQKFSTYIFSLHAGPYASWESTYKRADGSQIPLGLYARKTLAKHVKPNFWFDATKKGFRFFERYFSTDYPYKKYDQVIVPDFNSGAMENVGAVTFNEFYVSRDLTPLRSNRRGLNNVILHEMAHMWFGNLVTMNWWDDLWLNESFATFMAYTAAFEATEFKESWESFTNRKERTYTEDLYSTTHPIETFIKNTSEASSNFDQITYGKGAASLRQLVFLIGTEAFRKGLADYFKKHKEGNTVRADFMKALQSHTNEDLSKWTQDWLQTSGLNLLSSSFECKNGVLDSIKFEQSGLSGDKKNKTHKVKIALWNQNTKSPFKIIEKTYEGSLSQYYFADNTPCPKAVFPNWEGHDYTRLSLDRTSLGYFQKNISKFKSNLLKTQLWSTFSFMFKKGQIMVRNIPRLVLNGLENETDPLVAQKALSLIFPYYNIFHYYDDKELSEKEQRTFSKSLVRLIERAKGTDLKKVYFRTWASTTYSLNPQEILSCLNNGCSFKKGFDLELDQKWRLVGLLASLRHKETLPQMKKLQKIDQSRKAEYYALSIESKLEKDKASKLKETLKSQSLKLQEKSWILRSLVPYAQMSEYPNFNLKAYNKHIDFVSTLEPRIQRMFIANFPPYMCSEKTTDLDLNSKSFKRLPFAIQKNLMQSLDRNQECLVILGKDQKAKKSDA